MIAGFKLRVFGGGYDNAVIDVGLVYEYLLEDLDPSTEYSVEILAYDEQGLMSAYSSPVSATTLGEMMLVDDEGYALVDDDDFAFVDYS